MPRRRSSSSPLQTELFAPVLPDGFAYGEDVLSTADEQAVAQRLATLPFQPFEFHSFLGKRRVVSFGWRYEYGSNDVQPSGPMPDFLLPLRDVAASFAAVPAEALQQVLINEYQPGAGIGWHRDKPMFGDVIALSLLGACRLRFRREVNDEWQRTDITVMPRSAYVLRGPARWEWQHSIPPAESLRYSLTFRTFKADKPA